MERNNGCDVDMEDRLHSGSSRLKSKVPRARFVPRFGGEFADVPTYECRNGTEKNHIQSSSIQVSNSVLPPLAPQQGDTDETKEWQKLLGERVCISGVKQGILRYYGRTNFAQGHWCGVELDEPVGKNNGTVSGVVYFRCLPNHGIFAPVSKVSKLNDLSGNKDWRPELKQGNNIEAQNLEYNVRYPTEELYHERKYIRTSRSDPTFLMNAVRTVLPHNSESFPYDERSNMERREHPALSLKHKGGKHGVPTSYDPSAHRERSSFNTTEVRTNITSNPLSACLMSKYGYAAKNQYLNSKVVRLAEDEEKNGGARAMYRQSDFLQRTARVQTLPNRNSIPSSSSFTAAKEEYENYFVKTSASSGQMSPQSERKHYSGIQLMEDYRISSEKLPNSIFPGEYPQEEEEFLLVDDDDQMSMDCDESLGILTPNQMKDFTLLGETPQATTCSDIRGIDFPSSESFDDINDLPEDEQVQVSVHYLPDSSPVTRSLEISKQNAFHKSKVGGVEPGCDERHSMISSTDKFLVSISSKDFSDYNIDTRFSSTKSETLSEEMDPDLHNDFSSTQVLKSNLTAEIEKVVSKFSPESKDFDSSNSEEVSVKPNLSGFIVPASEGIDGKSVFCELSSLLQSPNSIETRGMKERCIRTSFEAQNLSDNKKLKLITMENTVVEDAKSRGINFDIDSSHDSLLQVDQEHGVSKEKLTVSWEDCVTHNSDCVFGLVERPDSVYTVASNDTGYQEEEDGEFDVDAVAMATSIDSTEDSKRFSTASRDSCIVPEDVDGYKIAESNSTSGYSTGLSDSCCNDRQDDDSASCKPLTDESIQDSVGPCDSEDAFSLHDSVDVIKETVVETSDVTEPETALFLDSTSDALCETMVEDSTLTEIHELLMSPDDNLSSLTNPKDNEVEMSTPDAKDRTFTKTEEADRTFTVIETPPSTCKSTPEKKQTNTFTPINNNRSKSSARIELQRNQRASLQAKNAVNKSNKPEDVSDRKKQVVKSPKKNVMSKIKAMLEATSCKTVSKNNTQEPTEMSPPRRAVSAPKKSRWEAVTSKIAASLAEEKTKPRMKRDIRSKVDTNLTLARQQACKSPRLDSPRTSIREGSMSPTSVSSRDKRALVARNSSPSSFTEDRSRHTKEDQKSPRHLQRLLSLMAGCAPVCRMTYVIQTPPGPGKASRSTSPVAPSESSTNSVSLNSHNSRSKIAQWKGSNSTVGSAAVPAVVSVKKAAIATSAPRFKPPLQTTKPPPPSRMVTKKAPEHAVGRGLHHPAPKPVRPPMWLSKAELSQEIQHLGNLCEARTKELNRLKMETKHVTVGFDAFAALFKYMVEDLNALSVPKLVEDLEKTLKQLENTKQDLAFYEKEVEELKAHHCQEQTALSDKLFATYQAQEAALNSKHQEQLYSIEMDHQRMVENLSNNHNLSFEEAKANYEKKIEKLQQEIVKQKEELQMNAASEIKDLEEKHVADIKNLKIRIDDLQKKCADLKQHSKSVEDAMQNDTDTKLQWVTSRKIDLEKEVESLKAVLEMKNSELRTFREQNLEMDKQSEELTIARERIKMLQAKEEDLRALMESKTELERKLSSENHYIRETYEKETKVNKRLSMENEELQWRLRQAEHSIISDSLLEVSDNQEEDETPLTPPPHSVSRSVFFTFVDKDDKDCNSPQSPGSQYKKIGRSFSVNYKTSPARTPFKSHSSTTSPRKAKSHSEPPPPPLTVEGNQRKLAKQPLMRSRAHQKRQRYESDTLQPSNEGLATLGDATSQSVGESMASSASSENDVFETKDRLLEEHKDQIMVSLDILREQRSMEEVMDETETPCDTEKSWDHSNTVSQLESSELSQSGDFTDPKTYYHMTFPVLREPGADCDMDDNSKETSNENSPDKEESLMDIQHSILEGGTLARSDAREELKCERLESNEAAILNVNQAVSQDHMGNVEKSHSGHSHHKTSSSIEKVDSIGNRECQEKVQNRWHTM